MDLHRAKSTADWESVPAVNRNIWQRLAANTYAVVTPGNIFTILGLLLIIYGLCAIIWEDYWLGFATLVVGRLCDVLDGWLAAYSGTKSPLGEFFDATVDKLTTAAILVTYLLSSLTNWVVLTALTIPQLVIAFIAFRAWQHKSRLHPSRVGKLSMAAAWVSLLGIVLIQAVPASIALELSLVTYLFVGLSVVLSTWAIYGYLRPKTI